MKAAPGSNQAEDLSQGHVPNGDMSDPHLHTVDGMHIGLGSNFGIEHYGIVKGMHEGSWDASRMKSEDD